MQRFNYIIPMDFIPLELQNQEWKYITQDMVPGVYDYYMIGSAGQIWNRREQRLMSLSPAANSYLAANLSGEFGPKTTMVHRLVAMAFVPNPDPINRIVVNHIDGNKFNNDYRNLEWVTAKENIAHAIRTGLMDPSKCAKYTEDERNMVRNLLAEHKYSCKEISEMTGVSKSVVSHIRYGESWKNENQYDPYSIRNRISKEEVHKMCKYFEMNNLREYSTDFMRDALEYCGLGTDDNWKKIAQNIYFRKNYLYISSIYNF